MSSRSKKLVLALVTALALTAVAAPLTSAAEFHSGSTGNTYIKGIQIGTNQIDLANGANVKCTTTEYSGWYFGTTEVFGVAMTPTYKTCTSSGQTTTISTGDCSLVLESPFGSEDSYSGSARLKCELGSIKIAVGDPSVSCTVTIAPQALVGSVDYEDNTTATANQDDITSTWTLSSITYTSTGSVCGANGTAKLTGKVTLKGSDNPLFVGQRDLWIA